MSIFTNLNKVLQKISTAQETFCLIVFLLTTK